MSSKQMEMLRQMLHNRLLAAAENAVYATIKEVDEAKRTCKAEIGNIIYEDILLYSIENPDLKGFVFIPAVDSVVLVSRIGTDRMFVESFSEIDKVIFTLNDLELVVDGDNIDLKKGEKVSVHADKETIVVKNDASTIEVNPDEILFNGGDLGGFVKIEELKKNLDSLKAFVEAMHNALLSSFSAVGAAMGSVGANGAASYSGSMAGKMIQIKDMENKKVKH